MQLQSRIRVSFARHGEAGDPLPCMEIQVRIRITYSMCGPAEDPDPRVAASVCCCRTTHSSGHLRPPSCLCRQCRPPGRSQLCFRPSQVAVNQQTLAAHLTNVCPAPASSRSGCDADWCGSAADKLSGWIGTLAIAFQIRRWSSLTLMSIVSHHNWWSVVFEREELLRDQLYDLWHPKRKGNSWRVAFLVRVGSWANGKCHP